MAVTMALASVGENKNTFPGMIKGRKGISPTKLMTTGNRGASSRMAWAPSCTKSNGNQYLWVGSWPTEVCVSMVTIALLHCRSSFSSQYLSKIPLSCPWEISRHEGTTGPREKARECVQWIVSFIFSWGVVNSHSHLRDISPTSEFGAADTSQNPS